MIVVFLAYCVIIVVKNKSKVLCVLCVYFVLDWSGFHR